MNAIFLSLVLVLAYALLVLGNCTPVGCRVFTGILSSLVLVFALGSGFGIAGSLGEIFYSETNLGIAFILFSNTNARS